MEPSGYGEGESVSSNLDRHKPIFFRLIELLLATPGDSTSVSGPAQFGLLVEAKLDRDRQVHRHGLTIQSSGLIFPLVQCLLSRFLQQQRSGEHGHS
jgi:hypothetical protein